MAETNELNYERLTPLMARLKWLDSRRASIEACKKRNAEHIVVCASESSTNPPLVDTLRLYVKSLELELNTIIEELESSSGERDIHATALAKATSEQSEVVNRRIITDKEQHRISLTASLMGLDAGIAETKRVLLYLDKLEVLIDDAESTSSPPFQAMTIHLQSSLDGLADAVMLYLPNTPNRQKTGLWSAFISSTVTLKTESTDAQQVRHRQTLLQLVRLQVSDIVVEFERRREKIDGQLHATDRR